MPVAEEPLNNKANVDGSGTALSVVTLAEVVAGPSTPRKWMIPPEV